MDISELNIKIKDFSYICRICLTFEEFKPHLVDNTIATDTLCIDTLKIITGIEIKDDDKLPKNLCQTCLIQLTDIHKFINICKRTNLFLKSVLNAAEEKTQCAESDNPLSDNENEESFDEIDNTVLSERKIQYSDVIGDINKSSKKQLRTGSRHKLRKSKKRIEECECKICGKKFTRLGGLKRHSKIHLGIKPYKCDICDKTFVEKATLNRHHLIHTGEKPFECNLCGKSSTRKDQILEHINKHHPNAVNYDFVITEHKINKMDRNEIYSETSNGQIFPISGNDSVEDNLQIVDDSKNLTDFNFQVNEDMAPDVIKDIKFRKKKRVEICLCNLCGKVFRRRGYLKNHMAIHAKIKPFECKICGKGFTQRHVLTRHHLVHTKERPFQCNLCGKTFTRKENLMDHLKNHEEGNKPYLCFHCGKCFSNKDYLSKHLRYYLPGKGKKKINSEHKKCICPQCGKELHSVSYLKTHILTHTGEKPYECNICGNRFTVLRSLNHHLNIHKGVKPYQCTQCEKAFRTSGSLRKHLLLHTGERPFKCTVCEKGFIRRSHLKRHLRIH